MISYIIRRLGWMVVVIFGVMTIAFFISRVIPANPVAAMLPPQAPPEAIEKAEKKWGLDEPIHKQYVTFITKLFHGDLGTSIRTRRPVLDDLRRTLPATIELTIVSLIFGVGIGLPLGIISAVRNGKISDHLSRIFAIMGLSMPAFWTGILLLLVFYYTLGLLPGPGQLPSYMARPPRITGLITLDSALAGDWTAFWSGVRHLVLPGFTLGWLSTAAITRIARSSMLDVMNENYIQTARMKGLRESTVLLKHGLKNALIPTITVIGLRIASLLEGAVLTETVFSWPGLGRYSTNSFLAVDFPAVVGAAMVFAFMYSFSNLIVDLIYAYLDPRIRYT